MASKGELREILREEIAALPDEYLSESNEGLFLQVASLKEFIGARNIMVYHSVKREPDTIAIIKAALSVGKTVAFPYCLSGAAMQARVAHDIAELRPAMLGIPAPDYNAPLIAPEELELVIVPALTYDRAGYRIGYGGGYYDRFLRGCPAFTVGLARERLIRDVLPVEPHDVAVKCVITELGIKSCG